MLEMWLNDGAKRNRLPTKVNHDYILELVSKELNHLAAILHVYAGGLNFMKWKKKILLLFFKKKMEILLHFLSFL